MAYATDDDLTTRIPATLAVASSLRAVALADAAEQIDDLQFLGRTVRAQVYLAAHYLALDPASGLPGGEGGLVTSRSAGEISVGYAGIDTSGLDPLLATTSYGRRYLEIANTVCALPEVG